MKKHLPIGVSDFQKIIKTNYYYVDKSLLIKEILDFGAEATLIPRPRRFGKTLNISMLKYYFEKSHQDHSDLFKDLAIWQAGVEYRQHQGRYPVIYLTFKDIYSTNWEDCLGQLKRVIAREYKRHEYLLNDNKINGIERKIYHDIMNHQGEKIDYEEALKNLSQYLHQYHKQKVMILIDEYDTPVQKGYLEGYYMQDIHFMRNFLSGGLKDNTSLEKGILTAILRVAKESIFSGLNNFVVYSILKEKFSTYFGLLEGEVAELLKYYHIETKLEDVQSWYNGYNFGGNIVYNPWSIINYANEHKQGLTPHWLNTSGNALAKQLILTSGKSFKEDIEKLIKGHHIEKNIDENVVFADLDKNPEALWSFLLFTGYLKVTGTRRQNKRLMLTLQIPNQEVEYFYEETIKEWLDNSIDNQALQEMLTSLIEGDIALFSYHFRQFVQETMSYFDPTGKEPERVYQAFIMGLLVTLKDKYHVKSNRESGLGRYDLALIPKDIKTHPKGVIIEIKRAHPAYKETLKETLAAAQKQINDKNYAAELLEAGLSPENIVKIAIAFKGKELLVSG